MAVVVQQKFAGSTVDQYDRALAKLGMTAEGPHIAPGLLFHYVVAIDEGVEITDIWTTREGFEKFAEEKILPVAQEVGISPSTSVAFTEVLNYNTAGWVFGLTDLRQDAVCGCQRTRPFGSAPSGPAAFEVVRPACRGMTGSGRPIPMR
jgi:hypothetical protein